MSQGQWNEAQVREAAKEIEQAARDGNSSRAFQEIDTRIKNSNLDDAAVRRANAAAVTAQLERDGFLPVCGFDMAKSAGSRYRAPQCGDRMSSEFNILTSSPAESIERAIYARESHAPNLQFGDIRPSVPKTQNDVVSSFLKSDTKGDGKSGEQGAGKGDGKSGEQGAGKGDGKSGEQGSGKGGRGEENSDRKGDGKSDGKGGGKSEIELMKAQVEELRNELNRLRAEKNQRDTALDGKPSSTTEKAQRKGDDSDTGKDSSKQKSSTQGIPEVNKSKGDDVGEMPNFDRFTWKQYARDHFEKEAKKADKQIEEKSADQVVARALLKKMVGELDLSVAAQRKDEYYGLNQDEVKANVAINTSKDGTTRIAGEPYGFVDLDAKTKFEIKQDGSILATDSKGNKHHFLSKPDATGMLLETTDKHNNVLKKYAPNSEKLVSETITRDKDGAGYTSFKQYNTKEAAGNLLAETFLGPELNPLNTNRDDWMTASTKVYGKDNVLKSETIDYGKSSHREDNSIRKIKEVFHYENGKKPKDGVYAEHIYDNGYKFTEESSGQTYLQRRVVTSATDPAKYRELSAKNGTINHNGTEWALSNKLLRPGVRVEKNQRDLPENYWRWYNEGDL